VTTEVPGLQIALARPPVELTLDLQRLNGDLSSVTLLFPDEVSALAIKVFATTVRITPTDRPAMHADPRADGTPVAAQLSSNLKSLSSPA